ncbi:MAG: hypothetical protein B6D41_07450 [Chloroflexi bacterium UTCFX4]|jgi:uncharacterized protein YutE (UPF0331/DUF86 family)|nr:MAG: hypothetical protein B6D41_07450 [Chloroflexi bacterium UTCFX4]
MVKVKEIQARLAKLEEYVQALERYSKLTRERIQQDLDTEWAIERVLQNCIQVVIDIATHLLASASNKRADDYTQAIVRLGEFGVLPRDFANSLKGMAGFRNILVHGYLEVDEDKVYDNIQRGLEDFPQFATYVHEWMQKQGLLKDNE